MIDRVQSYVVDRRQPSDPRVVTLDSGSATTLIDAISSEMARRILTALHDEPDPPSRIADRVDTSLANVNYHLENLEDAGLITDVDTWYSEKGREMKVYAPTNDPLVFAGDADRTREVRSLLQQVGAAVVLLAGASWLVQWVVSHILLAHQQTTALRKATAAGTVSGLNLTPIPPGVLFFTGGTFVLSVVVLLRYISTRV